MESSIENYGWSSVSALSDHLYTLPAIFRLLQDAGSGSLKILDAGCGNGYISTQLRHLGHDVTAFDLSPDGIDLAKQEEPSVRWFVRSVYDDLTDLSESGFDVIVSSEVIEHLFSPAKFLANMNSLLRRDGMIILTTPYHGYLKNLALSIFNAWDKHHTVDWEGGILNSFQSALFHRC